MSYKVAVLRNQQWEYDDYRYATEKAARAYGDYQQATNPDVVRYEVSPVEEAQITLSPCTGCDKPIPQDDDWYMLPDPIFLQEYRTPTCVCSECMRTAAINALVGASMRSYERQVVNGLRTMMREVLLG